MASPQITLEAFNMIVHSNAAGVFGITPEGVPFYSYAKIPVSEHALVGVRLEGVRPYLEKPPRLSGLEGEIQRLALPRVRVALVIERGVPERGERSLPVERGVPERGVMSPEIDREPAGRVEPVPVDAWGRAL